MKVSTIISGLALVLLIMSSVFGQQTFAAKTPQAPVNPKIKSQIHRASSGNLARQDLCDEPRRGIRNRVG